MATFDRRPFRTRRGALARSVRRDAAAAVAASARLLDELRSARAVAAYVPVRGELDPWPVIEACRARGTQVFLPTVDGPPDDPRPLGFAAFDGPTVLAPGRFAIPVPPPDAPRVAPDRLDVVLVPLLAFDGRGTRVGMGAGFYDRTFAFRRDGSPPPLLVGLAYHWQEVASIDPDPWDVPLDAVLTERGVRRFR